MGIENGLCSSPDCRAVLTEENTYGRDCYCKSCRATVSSATYYRNRKKVLEKQRQRLYGLTIEQWDAMEAAQGGGCAACGDIPDAALCVDHDHESGLVRALLCGPCNKAFGQMHEDPIRLLALARYAFRAKWSTFRPGQPES